MRLALAAVMLTAITLTGCLGDDVVPSPDSRAGEALGTPLVAPPLTVAQRCAAGAQALDNPYTTAAASEFVLEKMRALGCMRGDK